MFAEAVFSAAIGHTLIPRIPEGIAALPELLRRYQFEQTVHPQGDFRLAHIIMIGGRLVDDERTTTGVAWSGFTIKDTIKSDRVPLIQYHGLSAELHLPEKFRDLDEVKLKVTYPRMGAPGKEKKTGFERMEEVFWAPGFADLEFTYIFDSHWEMNPGIWTVTWTTDDTVLGSFRFEVYEPSDEERESFSLAN